MSARRTIVKLCLCTQHYLELLGEGWGLAQCKDEVSPWECYIMHCDNLTTAPYVTGAFLVNAKGNRFQVRNAYANSNPGCMPFAKNALGCVIHPNLPA